MFDAEKHAFDQHVKRVVPIGHVNLPHRPHCPAAGVVKHDIEAPKGAAGAVYHGFDIGLLCHISANTLHIRLVSSPRGQVEGRLSGLLIVVRHHDLGALI